MPSHRLLLALSVPLIVTACSGTSSPAASVSRTAKPTPSACPSPLPVATSYVVRAKDGVSDADLRKAIGPLSRLTGVVGVSAAGRHQLRIDLTTNALPDRGAQLFAALNMLGTICVPQ